MLIRTKLDLLDDDAALLDFRNMRMKPLAYQHASDFSREILAQKYVECSSLTQQDVFAVFDEAIV